MTLAGVKSLLKMKGAKFALFACTLSLLFGMLEMGDPLDQLLRTVRNKLRARDASGQIVVVGIDSKSLYAGHGWPWPRRDFAEILKELDRQGAKRIFFDLSFSGPSTEADDAAFEAALKDARAEVFLQGRLIDEPLTGKRQAVVPDQRFLKHARVASNSFRKNTFGMTWTVPSGTMLDGRFEPSLAARLANHVPAGETELNIDLAIDPRSLPVISAGDVLDHRMNAKDVAGKDIVVALASPEIDEWRLVPGYGLRPRAYTQILGAETLLRGIPRSIGWVPAWIVAVLVFLTYSRARRESFRRLAFFGTLSLILVLPLALESWNLFSEVGPAIFLLAILGLNRSWLRFKAALHKQGITNVVSGLKNLNALRELDVCEGKALVVANVRNFAPIRSAIDADKERELVDEITKRLTVGSDGLELYQGDDGIFAWFLEKGKAANVADHVEAVHSFFRSPLIVGGRAIQLHVTFGVDEDDSRSATKRLGTALVASKEAEKAGRRWLISDAAKTRDVEQKLELIGRLDSAITNGELWVAYQPKLDIASGQICGAEALVRWTHPERGQIAPDEFIYLAEEQNCIGNLTAFVLTNAIQLASRINSGGIPFSVAVNLSPRVIEGVAIDILARNLLEEYRLPPSMLTVEVTETAAMASGDEFLALLLRLRDMGVKISVDDYGSGLSTLGYIRTIPASEIKIDKAFIRNISHSVEDQVMVRSTVEMAHSLGRTVVAEGVESAEALDTLVTLGCDKAQGFFIGRPVPMRQLFRTVLKSGQAHAA